jgi:imidazolonepropionase-like amidohydrolase
VIRALRGARLFDGERLLAEPVVAYRDGVIVSVGEAPPPGVAVTDLGDATLLPGLVDAHQHLVFDGSGTLEEQVAGRTDDELRHRARSNARRALAAGITTIRDLGDRSFVTLDLRDDPELPTVLAAGPPITVEGGHCWFLGGACRDRAAMLEAVAERARRGCDVVKVMVTGGAMTPTFPMWASQLTVDDLAAVVEAAHAAGLPVAAHCHGVDGIADALEAGVDTIEHCSFFTDGGRSEPAADLIARVAASGIPVSATIGAIPGSTPPPVVAANIALVERAVADLHALGATVVVGTDAGVGPGKPHDVLPNAAIDLVRMGVAPERALTILTASAAEVCGVGARKGRLAPGYDADVLAVDGDPLRDVSDLRKTRMVTCRGRTIVDASVRT